MGIDFFAETGGKTQIIVSLIRPCDREQCLECHGGDSLSERHSRSGSSGIVLALNQIILSQD
ncbi:hypothetical protein [Mesorhizobium sp. WSM4887]|uniref:hypothetical protein n=1 Tax=Mesorhizobium sp. WSM4887 TaxID=3038543 RepID=UPI00241781E9|nr:hypothetical protein [Mesorhizobium sp. WSM4887]